MRLKPSAQHDFLDIQAPENKKSQIKFDLAFQISQEN